MGKIQSTQSLALATVSGSHWGSWTSTRQIRRDLTLFYVALKEESLQSQPAGFWTLGQSLGLTFDHPDICPTPASPKYGHVDEVQVDYLKELPRISEVANHQWEGGVLNALAALAALRSGSANAKTSLCVPVVCVHTFQKNENNFLKSNLKLKQHS